MVKIIYNSFNFKYSHLKTTLSFLWVVSEGNRKNTELG